VGVARFSNHLPVQISFGVGVVAELADLAASLGARRPAVIADPIVLELASVISALDGVRDGSDTLTVIPVDRGEPTIDSVDSTAARLKQAEADLIIAIGGGSAMDTAKGARLLLNNEGSITTYTWPGEPAPIAPPSTPLVTIPTTAGTGSEVTGGVVMTNPRTNLKVAAPSPVNRAEYCLVDPELTLSLPAEPTLWGGLDALGQAIGSVVASVHTPVGDALGLEAIRLVSRALPKVMQNLSDLDARADVSCAALLAGLAMNVSEAGTEHSLAHPLGSLHHLPHGLTVGLMLVESMQHDAQFVADTFERIADALGAPTDGTNDGSRAVEAVRRLVGRLALPTLRECGITESDLPALVESAQAGWIPVEPGPWTSTDIRQAYDRAFAVSDR
jgi:choline dehydrogenase